LESLDQDLSKSLQTGSIKMKPKEVKVTLEMMRKELKDRLPEWREKFGDGKEKEARLNGIDAALRANQKAKGLANAAKKQVGGPPSRFR